MRERTDELRSSSRSQPLLELEQSLRHGESGRAGSALAGYPDPPSSTAPAGHPISSSTPPPRAAWRSFLRSRVQGPRATPPGGDTSSSPYSVRNPSLNWAARPPGRLRVTGQQNDPARRPGGWRAGSGMPGSERGGVRIGRHPIPRYRNQLERKQSYVSVRKASTRIRTGPVESAPVESAPN